MIKKCPLVGEACWGHECAWYKQVQGTHPQTGAHIDRWDCAINWIPELVLEGARQGYSTGKAVESFREEMVKGNNAFIGLLANELTATQEQSPKLLRSE